MDNIDGTDFYNLTYRAIALVFVVAALLMERRHRGRKDVEILLMSFIATLVIAVLVALGPFVSNGVVIDFRVVNAVLLAPVFLGIIFFVAFQVRKDDE